MLITDLFTKNNKPIKKTETICKRLLHPISITKNVSLNVLRGMQKYRVKGNFIISLPYTQSQLLLFPFAGFFDNKTLLITGYKDISKQAEVLDLVAKESTVLPSKFTFPVTTYDATGGVTHGIPFIIDGKKCRKLTSKGWQTFAQLKTRREFAASFVLQDNQIWVTGGRYGAQVLKSTEIINIKTNECKEGPELPTEVWGHAMAKLNETAILIIGGATTTNDDSIKKNCWFYDQHSSEFTPGPEMNDGRAWFGWGIISSSLHNGRHCLLVAGGLTWTGTKLSYMASGEILDFTRQNATWKKSNGLSIYILFI